METTKTLRYIVHGYKTENLSPDEQNAQHSNQQGIWLTVGYYDATSKHAACRQARAESSAYSKFRAVL
jgi:hypothetical protein